MPPCVECRVRCNAGNILRLKIGRHLVTHETDLAKDRRRDARIRRIEEWRDHKSRARLPHLMNVVYDLWKPFLPIQLRDASSLCKIQHEPVAIVIVAS